MSYNKHKDALRRIMLRTSEAVADDAGQIATIAVSMYQSPDFKRFCKQVTGKVPEDLEEEQQLAAWNSFVSKLGQSPRKGTKPI